MKPLISVASLLLLVASLLASEADAALPQAAARIKDEPESVWIEFVQLALVNKPLNLGQGFPDFAAPENLIEALHNATDDTKDPRQVLNNQYTRSFGHPRLVKALSSYYNQFRSFNQLDEPNEQLVITVGAYEALFSTILAFVNPGDEVLIIEPAFDAYAPMVAMAQGTSVYVPLRLTSRANNSSMSSSEYELDMAEFASKINNKTKLLVLNTPNNPLGKVYNRTELEQIAKLCTRHNILVLADEVYEQMFYAPDAEHLSIASLPGMWERTITVGSAGKTFSVTGWKIGWAYGPRELIKFVQLIHQNSVYTVATPLQESIARTLEQELQVLSRNASAGYWNWLRSDLRRKRDRMAAILAKVQIKPVIPEGGYFMVADFSPLAQRFPEYSEAGRMANRTNTNDYRFARWLSKVKKLQGIPASAFYAPEHKPLAADLIRFCFIKSDVTLDKLERLIQDFAASR